MMRSAVFHFFPDLNHFLIPERREGTFSYSFESGQSVKHLIEAAGIPHTEVGRITASDQPVGFDYQPQDGDRVEVFPATARNSPLPGEARFVLDNHLGRLAAYLRILGFDVLYRNDYDDEELAETSAAEVRVLLTRDRRLLMRKSVRFGYCLRSLDSRQQVMEVLRRYGLFAAFSPFQRCLRCNTPLQPVSKAAVIDRLEPLTKMYYEEFRICPDCGQIYWKGSHFEHMQDWIDTLQDAPEEP